MLRSRNWFMLSILIVVALLLAACPAPSPAAESGGGASSGESAAPAEMEPIKIGAIFDLTGPTSDVGVFYSEGIKGYIDFLNQNGGIDGHKLELFSADYAYAVDQAEQLYSQYVNQEGVVVFSGWGTGDTEALRGRIGDDQMPFVSASYSAVLKDPAEAPYNFLVGTTYSDQFILAIDRAIDEGATTIALFHNDSPFGTSPLEDGRAHAEAKGASVINFPMPRGATDYTAELAQAVEQGASHIVIQNVSSPAATLLKNVKDQGLDVTVMCLNWCTNKVLLELGGEAAEGTIGVNPFTFPSSGVPGLTEISDYLAATGGSLDDQGGLYVAGWVTMKVLLQGVADTVAAGQEITGENIRANLEALSNFDTGGITDPISFSAEDHAGNKTVQFFEVSGGAGIQFQNALAWRSRRVAGSEWRVAETRQLATRHPLTRHPRTHNSYHAYTQQRRSHL
ncbi:MAG: ABC transporter substrate-binding protein [Caldilineaceae bacterium]